jgi:hypothetical protein
MEGSGSGSNYIFIQEPSYFLSIRFGRRSTCSTAYQGDRVRNAVAAVALAAAGASYLADLDPHK